MLSEDRAKSVSKASSDAELMKHAAANGAARLSVGDKASTLDNGHVPAPPRHMSSGTATTAAHSTDDVTAAGAASTRSEDQRFLRVAMPDGSATVIYAKPNTTVRAAIAKLCERRKLDINMVDVYAQKTNKVRRSKCLASVNINTVHNYI